MNYTFRMHDPRVGRFLSLDPLSPQYPHNSPYVFSENRVVDSVELEGMELMPSQIYTYAKLGLYGETTQKITNGVEKGVRNLASPKWWWEAAKNLGEDAVLMMSRNPAALANKYTPVVMDMTQLALSDDTTTKAQVLTEIVGSIAITKGATKLVKTPFKTNFSKTKKPNIPVVEKTPIISEIDNALSKDISETYKNSNTFLDCSDLAKDLLKYDNGAGKIIEITAKTGPGGPVWGGGRTFNGLEYGKNADFDYHQVYEKNGYIYDPMYSPEPIKTDAFKAAYEKLNPESKLEFKEIE